MKNKIIILIFLFGIGGLQAQNSPLLKPPKVDKRVELLAIVFRLAGNPEYNYDRFPQYVEKVENHFGKYRKHKLIKFIKKKLHKRGVSYDAVMQMAIHITQPPEIQPIVPFTDKIPENRWGKKNATKFLKLLNQFYTETHCEEFFEENAGLYEEINRRFHSMYQEIDLDWYQNFYGEKPKDEFKIIIGLGKGPRNYGPKLSLPDKREKGKQAMPKKTGIRYSKDKKKLIIDVELKPCKEYQFVLSGWYFVSTEGFSIKDYTVNFKTKK